MGDDFENAGDFRMTQSVTRLKELLFDSDGDDLSSFELRIEDATRRLKALEDLSDSAKRERQDVLRKLDTVYHYAGNSDHLVKSVASVLDSALLKAEETRHDQMSRALAPLVVQTIKTELRNSQDQMVEALYPITGRLVKAYVASAIKDLSDQINARLSHNPVSLRVRSMVSGVPISDLMIQESQQLRVEEVFLIRRGVGSIIARWPEGDALSNSDVHMSGILSAINDFATHAFDGDGGDLRSFELDQFCIYMRASPLYLLAVKCEGIAPTGVETVFDDAFLDVLERLHHGPEIAADDAPADHTHQGGAMGATGNASNSGNTGNTGAMGQTGGPQILAAEALAPFAERIGSDTTAIYDRNANAGKSFEPMRILCIVAAVAIVSSLVWWGYAAYQRESTLSTARQIIAATPELQGYPIDLKTDSNGQSLHVSGLLPTQGDKQDLLHRLRAALPQKELQNNLGVLPSPPVTESKDYSKDISALRVQFEGMGKRIVGLQRWRMLQQSLSATHDRLQFLVSALASLHGQLQAEDEKAKIAAALDGTRKLENKLTDVLATLPSEVTQANGNPVAAQNSKSPVDDKDFEQIATGVSELTTGMRDVTTRVESVLTPNSASLPISPAAQDDVYLVAQKLAAETERATAMTLAAVRAYDYVTRHVVPPAAPSARQKLMEFSASHAIFFSSGVALMQPEAATKALDELAALLKENSILIRVVGYTDANGNPQQNAAVAMQRAQFVRDRLIARGIAQNRLVALGRTNVAPITNVGGTSSPNRRVQFEVGFKGEARP